MITVTDDQAVPLPDGAMPLPDILAEMADDMALRTLDRTELRTALNWAAAAGRAEGAATERERIVAAISPEQFRKLADWFDTDDEFKEAMFPETWSPGDRQDDVQRDLRKVADLLDGTP